MQTINRNNYEEFFLLYVDDELNAEEKIAVENFVAQNADLAIEFDMLLQTKLPAELTGFDNKDSLLRTEGNNINETNYDEYFLLYIDNELSLAKRGEVEMYVLQHPKLQDEFTTLKQAVLAPETISYNNKEDLYKPEKRRTVYLKPWRLAAAAIFIGVCAVGFWMMQKPGNAKHNVAANKIQQSNSTSNNGVIKAADTFKQQQIVLPNKTQTEITIAQQSSPKKEIKSLNQTTIIKKKKAGNNANNRLPQNETNNDEEVIAEHSINERNVIEKQQKEPPVVTKIINDNAPQHITQKQNDIAALDAPNNNKQQDNFKTYNVAYKEINTSDDDRSLHVGMLDLNKDKVKTLFKKAGRIFGNKSNDLANKDGKLQVANFEIDTKKQ